MSMRIYHTATIQEERLTGFQSPCSEFAEKPLSLDEKFDIGNPSMRLIQVEASNPTLKIYKGDWLLIDLAKRPGSKSIVVAIAHDEVRVYQGEHPALEDVQVGVVRAVLRDYRTPLKAGDDHSPPSRKLS